MNLRTLLAVNTALMGALAAASGETINYLSTAPANWVGYAGAPVPALITTVPGSIVDAPSPGSSYGRLNTAFAAYPISPSWRVGDTFAFHFDGVVSNNTAFRMEFTDSAHVAALQFVIVNGGANNADSMQINALGGTSALLFNGNFGGAGGVGSAQHVLGNLTLSILSGGTTASVSGSVADSFGNLWTGPNATFNLGTAPASIFAGVNLNAGAGVSGINTLNWALTPVPEPSTAMLFVGLGLAGLLFGRRVKPNN